MAKVKKLNEKGLVSIVVTMILIIVMTLVVLAMSRNATREQRQSLDRQLSDQAFYNAESGIGDWANYLYTNTTAPDSKSTCDVTAPGWPTNPSAIPTATIDTNNSYSCILYDKSPTDIEITDLGVDDAKTYPIRSTTAIDKIRFTWSNPTGTTIANCNSTVGNARPPAMPTGCSVGGLRIDLVHPGDTGSIDRDFLRTQNFIATFLPNSSAASRVNVNRASGVQSEQGVVGVGQCSATDCMVEIRNVGLAADNTFYLNVRSIYSANNITITALDADNNPLPLISAQYVIDVTGKSVDVLRRVRVRLPAVPQVDTVNYALRTADAICKLIVVNRDAGTATLSTTPPQCDPN